MTDFITHVLPFVTVVAFIYGMARQLYIWKNLPAPKMTLTPAPDSEGARLVAMIKETLFFPSLFKTDKLLWVMSWLFHMLLLLVFMGHMRVISWLPDKTLASLGMTPDQINTMSTMAGGGAGVLMLVCLVVILLRRAGVQRSREISTAGDYFALFLLLAIVVTGDGMRLVAHCDLAQTRDYFYGLVTLSPIAAPANTWFLAHFLLAQIMLIYMPFSKILHFGGVFFSLSLVRKH